MDPLENIRVLDLSQHRTGAQVTRVLADLGADVIWVERPGGSPLRRQRAFPYYSRGKQVLRLDLKNPVDVEEARRLAERADVLVECFRPGVATRLGFGYETLAANNPRLVYASITGFGSSGPYAGVKAYEGVVQAKLGVFSAFRRMTNQAHPPFVTVPWCSFAATQTALHGILAALIERERSGTGQRVETNLAHAFATLDTWEWFIDHVIQHFPDAYTPAEPWADGIPMSPLVHMLLVAMTRDGHWLQFAAAAPHLFAALLKALGLEWMLTDPAWKGIPVFEDGERRLALFEAMQASVAERTLAEWESVFASSPDVFAEVYRAGPDVLEHPQLVHDGYPVTIDDPERGPVRQPGAPFLINGRPPTLRASPSSVQHVWCTADTTSQQGPPHHDPETSSGRFPLEGVTILEFAVLFAAPYAATLLTDLGARVIKVEPLTGDPIRTILPFPEMGGAKAMQGKESICVDLTTAEGREIVHRLARRADVVLQGFRAGVAERLGIDSRTLRSINPDLVYVNATGYGDDGPCADRPAFAPSIGAASGIALANVGSTVREESGLDTARRRESAIRLSASCTIAQAQADGFAALGAATAILAGLLARARTGAAPVVSSSMLATCTHAMAEHVVDYDGAPLPPDPGDGMWGPDPLYRIYPAASGWVFLAAPHSEDWTALVKALAPWSDLASDERFESADSRQRNADELAEALGRIFATRDAAAWERDLLAADVACVQVTTDRIERVLKGEVGQTSGYVVEVTHPTFDRHPRLAPPVRFSRSSTRALPGVLAGSATDEVLTELGYATADIADLRSRRVVR